MLKFKNYLLEIILFSKLVFGIYGIYVQENSLKNVTKFARSPSDWTDPVDDTPWSDLLEDYTLK